MGRIPNLAGVTTYTAMLDREQMDRLEALIRDGNFRLREVDHARVSGVKPDFNVTLYASGKVVVQGKGTREFVEFVLEPEVLGSARLGYEEELEPERLLPRLGVDESGKGDFFGPLCIAGVYVNADVVRAWKDAGIQDSKNIGSDSRIADLATRIRETPGCVHTVVTIGNEAYNRMHQRNGSVNRVLAWGHARVIENLLLQRHRMVPAPVRAISDQFAQDKDTVAKALMSLGREIELVQRHRAEEDLAVAAAPILARDEFVQRLKRLGETLGVTLPKGASAAVEDAGRRLVERHGEAGLRQVAKMHFRTAYRVLGLPEPPKVEWKRRS
ncbi:MAG: ribonuclease HIII [Verrucomicrobiota bacterium]